MLSADGIDYPVFDDELQAVVITVDFGTLASSRLAGRNIAARPRLGGQNRGEGSARDVLGRARDGDNR